MICCAQTFALRARHTDKLNPVVPLMEACPHRGAFRERRLVIQFNILDPETLRDEQKHPEKYANLQVRVCGWNVRWNDIPKVEQDKFILRQECIAQ